MRNASVGVRKCGHALAVLGRVVLSCRPLALCCCFYCAPWRSRVAWATRTWCLARAGDAFAPLVADLVPARRDLLVERFAARPVFRLGAVHGVSARSFRDYLNRVARCGDGICVVARAARNTKNVVFIDCPPKTILYRRAGAASPTANRSGVQSKSTPTIAHRVDFGQVSADYGAGASTRFFLARHGLNALPGSPSMYR